MVEVQAKTANDRRKGHRISLKAGLLVGLAAAKHQDPFDGAFAAFPDSGLVAKLLKPCVLFVEEVDEGRRFREQGGPCFLVDQQADALCAGFCGVWIVEAFRDNLIQGKGLFFALLLLGCTGLLEGGRLASPPDTPQKQPKQRI